MQSVHDIFNSFCTFVDDLEVTNLCSSTLSGKSVRSLSVCICQWAEHDEHPLSLVSDRIDKLLRFSAILDKEVDGSSSTIFGSLLSLTHAVLNCSEETNLTRKLSSVLYNREGFLSHLLQNLSDTLSQPHVRRDFDFDMGLEVCSCLMSSRIKDAIILSKGEGRAAMYEIYGVRYERLYDFRVELLQSISNQGVFYYRIPGALDQILNLQQVLDSLMVI